MNEVSQELFDALCARIMQGESARFACAGMGVSNEALHEWLDRHPELQTLYADAHTIRELQYMELILQELPELAAATTQEQIDVICSRIESYKRTVETLQYEDGGTTPRRYPNQGNLEG